MPLSDGDPADNDDTWFRVLTDKRYVYADGRLHNKAFTGKAIARPKPEKNRDWTHEISGRLLSLVGDVGKEANEFCDAMTNATGRPKDFSGIAHSVVSALRTQYGHVSIDVCYTPLDHDKAHADIAFYKSIDDDKEMLIDWLQTVLKAIRPDQLAALNDKRRP
jgi:hypothetical protein